MSFVLHWIFFPLILVFCFSLVGFRNFFALLFGFFGTIISSLIYFYFTHFEKLEDYNQRQKDRILYKSHVPAPRIFSVGDLPHLESQIKIVANPQNEKRVQFWYSGTLRRNQFVFQEKQNSNKQASEGYKRGVVCMDGVVVTIMKTKKEGFWHGKNYLKLEHPGRPLLGSQYQLFVYFQSPREMEEWYYALERSASLHSNQNSENQLFRILSLELKPGKYSQTMEANWFTAFSHRFFFNYFENPKLLDPFAKIINKKFSKLPLPDMIKSYTVHQIQFGASLPHFSNVQLLYLDSCGSMGFSTSLRYYGGLHFRIELVVESKFLTLVFDKKTIPAVFDFSLNNIVGDIEVHIAGPPSDQIWFCFKEKPNIKMTIETAVGFDSSDNTQIPKVGKILKELLRNEINDKAVFPSMQSFSLPKLSKKNKNKRENWGWACDAEKGVAPLIAMDELKSAKKNTSLPLKFQPIDFSQLSSTQFKITEKPNPSNSEKIVSNQKSVTT